MFSSLHKELARKQYEDAKRDPILNFYHPHHAMRIGFVSVRVRERRGAIGWHRSQLSMFLRLMGEIREE